MAERLNAGLRDVFLLLRCERIISRLSRRTELIKAQGLLTMNGLKSEAP
jgi:hypothetical protein